MRSRSTTWRPFASVTEAAGTREERAELARAIIELPALVDAANKAWALLVALEPDPVTKPRRTPAKYLALIRVDHEALVRGAVEGDETCEIAGLGPVPVGIASALLGDAILKIVITKGMDVANVTHLGRSPTMAQRVALWWRSPATRS